MKKWAVVFDVNRCNGCCNCVLATMDEYVGNAHEGYSEEMPRHGSPWLGIQMVERGAYPFVDVAYQPTTCHHCEIAPCMERFPDLVSRRSDGIVMIHADRARGVHALVDACPFGAIHWNEERQVAQTWNLDAHLLDAGWKEPRAAQACPTGALQVLNLSDEALTALKQAESLEQSPSARALGSRLFLKGGHRLRSPLIGGSVVTSTNGLEEPLCELLLELFDGAQLIAMTQTDSLGNFRFDQLPDLGDEIMVALHHEGDRYEHRVRKILGTFRLGPLHLDAKTKELHDRCSAT